MQALCSSLLVQSLQTYQNIGDDTNNCSTMYNTSHNCSFFELYSALPLGSSMQHITRS